MTVLSPPTSCLPPIGEIQHCHTEDLTKALRYIRLIYNPEVRGIRRIGQQRRPKRVLSSALSTDPNLDVLRSDAFERAYCIRWLTALVSKAYRLLDDSDGLEFSATAEKEALIQDAASLLAICAGTASAGTITRVFRFSHEPAQVEIQLTDAPLENQDYSSVGAQTWGSACLLAEILEESPEKLGLGGGFAENPTRLRALELGAGTGLVSLTLAKLLESRACNTLSDQTTIIATDFHPYVLANLRSNVETNFPQQSSSGSVSISAHFLDWSQFPQSIKDVPPFNEPFDLILGADIIYEVQHARWIKTCIEKLLRRPHIADPCPTMSATSRFHIVIPLRPTHTLESSTIEEVFPFATTCQESMQAVSNAAELQLVIMSKDIITCEVDGDVRSRNGVGAEVDYVYYTIGWFHNSSCDRSIKL